MSFADEIKQAEKDGVVGSGLFKPQEGKNVIRIVDGPLRQVEEYEGKTRTKWLVLVIDRKDGVVKPWFMPHSIAKMIRDLQQSDEYAFEHTPMPYDITLTATGAGTRDVEYGVVAARKNTEITPEEMMLIASFGELAEYQRKITERRRSSPKAVEPGEIPV